MPNFESGVQRFIKTYAVVEVGFPVDWRGNPDISCKHCKFYMRSQQRCALTQQVLNFPEKYVGTECPLEAVEEVEE